MEDDAVIVVIVNWNGWRDTISCVESLLALNDSPMRLVVCDNASTDGSATEIGRWLDERLASWTRQDEALDWTCQGPHCGVRSVQIVCLPENLGYAGGLNAGIRWAQDRWSPLGFWLLNNDVRVYPGALDAMLKAHAATPGAGICGSVLLEWEPPHHVQAVAGRYRKWLGVGWHDRRLPSTDALVTLDLDYPVGASLFASADYLTKVGPMDARYFLYYEEIDWSERGRRHGFRPIVALRSRLLHKEGASTGSHGGVRNKSLLSERYGVINRLRVTRKFWPACLPLVWLSLLLVVAERMWHREWARAFLVLRLMASPGQWSR